MAKGRCAGCGEMGTVKAVTEHILAPCPKWLELFNTNHYRALDPGAEYRRWFKEERVVEKEQAREDKVTATNAAREAMADRFATRNILED
jgi:hypothetical protein